MESSEHVYCSTVSTLKSGNGLEMFVLKVVLNANHSGCRLNLASQREFDALPVGHVAPFSWPLKESVCGKSYSHDSVVGSYVARLEANLCGED